MSENESNERKVKLQKVESSAVKQAMLNLKEARIDSSDVRAVQKGLVSAASVGQVRTGIDQTVRAVNVQQVRSEIEQTRVQQKEKTQKQQ